MKNVLIGLVFLVLVGGGVYWFTLQGEENGQSEVMVDISGDDDGELGEAFFYIRGDGYLTEYTPKLFEAVSDAGLKRVLFFYANWCPICRPADRDFQENMSKIPDDVVVFRVNYNDPETDETEKALANKYGVTYQHTFVQVDGEGELVTSWNGGDTDELMKNIR